MNHHEATPRMLIEVTDCWCIPKPVYIRIVSRSLRFARRTVVMVKRLTLPQVQKKLVDRARRAEEELVCVISGDPIGKDGCGGWRHHGRGRMEALTGRSAHSYPEVLFSARSVSVSSCV